MDVSSGRNSSGRHISWRARRWFPRFRGIADRVTLSVQFALLAGQVVPSLAGAASGLAVIRQAASLVAAILMAAAVGSAITADLGSRKIRDEIEALEVMGISVVQRLVVPDSWPDPDRVALTGLVCFTGFLASYPSTCISSTARRVASFRRSRPSPPPRICAWR